jgi:hypothetical protein
MRIHLLRLEQGLHSPCVHLSVVSDLRVHDSSLLLKLLLILGILLGGHCSSLHLIVPQHVHLVLLSRLLLLSEHRSLVLGHRSGVHGRHLLMLVHLTVGLALELPITCCDGRHDDWGTLAGTLILTSLRHILRCSLTLKKFKKKVKFALFKSTEFVFQLMVSKIGLILT